MARKALQLVGSALAIALLASPASAWDWDWDDDKEYSRVVAFGDSFMDTGNRFQYNDKDGPWGLTWIPCSLNDWNLPRPDEVPPEAWNPDIFDGLCPGIPDDVYSNTFNLTNGPNYIQQVAAELGVRRSAGPAWLGRNFFRLRSNYAIGGAPAARVNDSKLAFIEPNLQDEDCDFLLGECPDRSAGVQVEKFLRQFRGNAPSDALYIVGFGANDAFTLFRRLGERLEEGTLFAAPFQFTPEAEGEIGLRVLNAIWAIEASLETLCEAGAETIVLANVPNVTISPAVPPGDEPALLAALTASWFNYGLDGQSGIQGIYMNPPGACADESKTIHLLDLFALTTRYLTNDPPLINPTTGTSFVPGSCLQTFGAPFGYFDEPCDRYFRLPRLIP